MLPLVMLALGRSKAKHAPPPGTVLEPDVLAVCLYESLRDREAEPRTASGVACG